MVHPGVSHRIARTEAEGLGNLSLRFFGATDKDLTVSVHSRRPAVEHEHASFRGVQIRALGACLTHS